jgi:hypothetical protein
MLTGGLAAMVEKKVELLLVTQIKKNSKQEISASRDRALVGFANLAMQ